jgi:NADH-quinone oxidoreductase subunit G
MRGLGSENIDYRLRNAEFAPAESARWLGTSIASLSNLQRVLVIGSNLRKDHSLFAQRIRQAARKGCAVNAIVSTTELSAADAWALPLAASLVAEPSDWFGRLAELASAIAAETGAALPSGLAAATPGDAAKALAKSLMGGERKAILLGNAATHHAQASSLLALANWIGTQTGASVGYLTEAANTVGAQLAGALPGAAGLNAGQMLDGQLKAVFLLNNEPEFDSAAGARAAAALTQTQMVVTLSPFKANMEFSDVLLPIAPFTETPGTFVNAEGRVQSFHAVVKPLGETRPAWKVLRVLGNMLGLPGFGFESSAEVLAHVFGPAVDGLTQLPDCLLGNATAAPALPASAPVGRPAVASIYQLDGLVRRAPALQLTADARQVPAFEEQEVSA